MTDTIDIEASGSTEWPGIRRLPYFFASMGIYVVLLFVDSPPEEEMSTLSAILALVGLAGIFVLGVQRFRNQGASGWWVLGFLVPFLNLYVGLRALAYPEGYAVDQKLDRAGKIICVVYLGVFVLGIIAAIALPAYQSYVEAAGQG